MTEKTGYGGWHYDDYDDDDTGHDDDYQGDPEQDFHEADPDSVHEDYTAAAEDFPDQREQLEHLLDFTEDDSGQTNFYSQYGKWKSKAYRRAQGKFKPPKRKHHRTPVFVKLRDLQGGDGG